MAGYKRVSEMTLEEKREKVAGFNVMEYFTDSNGRKEICPKLSDRVMLFKTEQTELMLLKKYMKKHRVSYDEAFDALDIAEERYGVYLEKIEQKE